MTVNGGDAGKERGTHRWLRSVRVALVPGPMDALLEQTVHGVLEVLRQSGHAVVPLPDHDTDAIITTARFGQPVGWRDSLLLTARKKYGLAHNPVVFTYVRISEDDFQRQLKRFERFIQDEDPDPAQHQFPGLAPEAYRVLHEQGRRGGPLLALERVIQAQAKSLQIVLIVGEREPKEAYHFNLVGAYPRSKADDPALFHQDIALRMVTVLSTIEANRHQVVGEAIPREVWEGLDTPPAMMRASQELGKRAFFTEMVRIADLVRVPVVGDAIASQYSEGCFATYDPALQALIATVTGSARPVDKGKIGEDDLAVIVGVKPERDGVLVRHVEGKRNDPPSSEAMEMMEMDEALPWIELGKGMQVPIARSKLHGHRGVARFDPRYVEFVPLDPPFYDYLVTCGTTAQAMAIKQAFARSEALRDPDDARQVVFTVLPGHGAVLVEKWVEGKAPFEVMLDYMDAGYIEIESRVPQGRMAYVPAPDGTMVLEQDNE
ncbi:MAG TPA: hypothetical protein EYP55_08865 [Anaerolineae bacterium]|nr:hypothetical protein [Anaerolineae bacterium]